MHMSQCFWPVLLWRDGQHSWWTPSCGAPVIKRNSTRVVLLAISSWIRGVYLLTRSRKRSPMRVILSSHPSIREWRWTNRQWLRFSRTCANTEIVNGGLGVTCVCIRKPVCVWRWCYTLLQWWCHFEIGVLPSSAVKESNCWTNSSTHTSPLITLSRVSSFL